jgi:hypothetical protein
VSTVLLIMRHPAENYVAAWHDEFYNTTLNHSTQAVPPPLAADALRGRLGAAPRLLAPRRARAPGAAAAVARVRGFLC